MSVTLRLQGLSRRASSYDIQKFFVGLDIPDEGIIIIGGSKGEAIVDVATWDEAYQALQLSGQQIRDSIINISVISSEEKQEALENHSKSKDSSCGRNGTEKNAGNAVKSSHHKTNAYVHVEISDFEANEADIKHFFDGLGISGMAFSKAEDSPKKIIAVIRFGKDADADEGFQRYKDSKIIRVKKSSEADWMKYGGTIDHDDNECLSTTSGHSTNKTDSRSPRRRSRSPRKHSRSPQKGSRSPRKRSRSPQKRSRSPRKRSRSPRKRSMSPRKRTRSPRKRSRSLRKRSRSPRKRSRSLQKRSRSPRKRSRSPRKRSRSPRKRSRSPQKRSMSPRKRSRSSRKHSRSPRKRSRSPQKRTKSPQSSSRTQTNDSKSPKSHSDGQESMTIEGFNVLLLYLSSSVEKKDIKILFYNLVSEDHIIFRDDERDRKKRIGFVTFTNKEHYTRALELDKTMFKGSILYILPISKLSMSRVIRKCPFHAYLYVKNFSPDVSKNDVKELFADFSLDDDDIFLLYDKHNSALGQAMVRFTSLTETNKAEMLNNEKFRNKHMVVKRVYLDGLVAFLHSHGLYTRVIEPDECVTQEDDASEDEEVTQDNDVHHQMDTEDEEPPEDDNDVYDQIDTEDEEPPKGDNDAHDKMDAEDEEPPKGDNDAHDKMDAEDNEPPKGDSSVPQASVPECVAEKLSSVQCDNQASP